MSIRADTWAPGWGSLQVTLTSVPGQKVLPSFLTDAASSLC